MRPSARDAAHPQDAQACIPAIQQNIVKLHAAIAHEVNDVWRAAPGRLETATASLDELLQSQALFADLL